jgi:hypothetical protein
MDDFLRIVKELSKGEGKEEGRSETIASFNPSSSLSNALTHTGTRD